MKNHYLEIAVQAPPVEIGGRSKPQRIAALFKREQSELERRYGPNCGFAPVFDDDGNPIGFRPTGDERRAGLVPVRAGASLAAMLRQQVAIMDSVRRTDAAHTARCLARLRARYRINA